MKRLLGVLFENHDSGFVIFDAEPEVAHPLALFGTLVGGPRHWHMDIDARYDVCDVLKYIEYLASQPATRRWPDACKGCPYSGGKKDA